MKTIFVMLIVVFWIEGHSQKVGDNRIIVTVSDTTKLYERVRQAIVFSNFIIKEDSKRDSLITYSERIDNSSIFVVAKAVIKGNQVEISGGYGLGYEDFWGFPDSPKGYKKIIYYKESEGWKSLRRIAIKLDSKIIYFNDNK